jgi:hypothetical protein
MQYRIQTFYPEAGLFMNTNHVSEDLEGLKSLAESATFSGFRVRIVDEGFQSMFEPPVRERQGDPSIPDIASLLGVPIISPEDFFRDQGGDVAN